MPQAVPPETDPELASYLADRGLHLREPKSVQFEETVLPGNPQEDVDDLLPQGYILDREPWIRFYMKIAWCFACLKLGRDQVVEHGGDQILSHLKAGILPTDMLTATQEIDDSTAKLLFRSASIEGSTVWLWRQSISDTDRILKQADPSIQQLLAPQFTDRVARESGAATWVKVVKAGVLDRASGEPGPEHRKHELTLRRFSEDGQGAIVCDISLFGGMCRVCVQLTSRTGFDAVPDLALISESISF